MKIRALRGAAKTQKIQKSVAIEIVLLVGLKLKNWQPNMACLECQQLGKGK